MVKIVYAQRHYLKVFSCLVRLKFQGIGKILFSENAVNVTCHATLDNSDLPTVTPPKIPAEIRFRNVP